MDIGKFFKNVSSDGHLPIGIGVFIVGTLVHIYHGLTADFVAFTTTVLGWLAHHSYMNTPDDPK